MELKEAGQSTTKATYGPWKIVISIYVEDFNILFA